MPKERLPEHLETQLPGGFYVDANWGATRWIVLVATGTAIGSGEITARRIAEFKTPEKAVAFAIHYAPRYRHIQDELDSDAAALASHFDGEEIPRPRTKRRRARNAQRSPECRLKK